MSGKTLDEEYPQGNPHAMICRHCRRTRVNQGWALICPNCDNGKGLPITRSLLG